MQSSFVNDFYLSNYFLIRICAKQSLVYNSNCVIIVLSMPITICLLRYNVYLSRRISPVFFLLIPKINFVENFEKRMAKLSPTYDNCVQALLSNKTAAYYHYYNYCYYLYQCFCCSPSPTIVIGKCPRGLLMRSFNFDNSIFVPPCILTMIIF